MGRVWLSAAVPLGSNGGCPTVEPTLPDVKPGSRGRGRKPSVVKGEMVGDIPRRVRLDTSTKHIPRQGPTPSLLPIVSPRQRTSNVGVVEVLSPEVRKAGGDLLADQP